MACSWSSTFADARRASEEGRPQNLAPRPRDQGHERDCTDRTRTATFLGGGACKFRGRNFALRKPGERRGVGTDSRLAAPAARY